MNIDPYNLHRFLNAQENGDPETYATALGELRIGQKRTHWVWYIFPQLRDLGRSGMAKFYGISSLDEARAYLAHPILGARLRECVAALAPQNTDTITQVMGGIDAMKLRSCLTLFIEAGGDVLFTEALARLYGGTADQATRDLLE